MLSPQHVICGCDEVVLFPALVAKGAFYMVCWYAVWVTIVFSACAYHSFPVLLLCILDLVVRSGPAVLASYIILALSFPAVATSYGAMLFQWESFYLLAVIVYYLFLPSLALLECSVKGNLLSQTSSAMSGYCLFLDCFYLPSQCTHNASRIVV